MQAHSQFDFCRKILYLALHIDRAAPHDGMINSSRRLFILAGLFAALTVLGAHIKIPLPYVPLTLQTFFVLLSGHLLGPLYGAASQMAYLLLGLIGLPVFAEGGGPAYVFKPTFGYLFGYPLASCTAGMIVHRGVLRPANWPEVSMANLLLANLAAISAIFLPGVFYLWWNVNFVLGQSLSFSRAIHIGVLIFLPGDLIKIAGVILLYRALQRRMTTAVSLPYSNRLKGSCMEPPHIRTGISYFGNRNPRHFRVDLEEIKSHHCNFILHTFSENDQLFYKYTVAELIQLSKAAGLEVMWIRGASAGFSAARPPAILPSRIATSARFSTPAKRRRARV